MPAVFLDAAALVALVNSGDSLHGKAKQLYSQIAAERTPLVTSDWVVTELLSIGSPIKTRAATASMVQRLQRSARTTIVEASRADWVRAFDLYTTRKDKEWSLVDCSSILICQERGIKQVMTADKHFAQAGLEVLL